MSQDIARCPLQADEALTAALCPSSRMTNFPHQLYFSLSPSFSLLSISLFLQPFFYFPIYYLSFYLSIFLPILLSIYFSTCQSLFYLFFYRLTHTCMHTRFFPEPFENSLQVSFSFTLKCVTYFLRTRTIRAPHHCRTTTDLRKRIIDTIALFNTWFMVKTCQLFLKCPLELPIQDHTLHLVVKSLWSPNLEHSSICLYLFQGYGPVVLQINLFQFSMNLELFLNKDFGSASPEGEKGEGGRAWSLESCVSCFSQAMLLVQREQLGGEDRIAGPSTWVGLIFPHDHIQIKPV